MLFNNGNNRPGIPHSTADEIVLPSGSDGRYRLDGSSPLKPDQPHWSYAAPLKSEMFSMILSGAQRLPNGNTLICAGASGTLLEVTPGGEQVWKYVNPVHGHFAGERRPGRASKTARGGLNPVNNALFRAYRYGADFPGLRGKVLQPENALADIYPAEQMH